jgi:Protein of unknown function (DUF1360)
VSSFLLLLLVCGTVFRATRFLTRDQLPLVAWPREQLIGYWYPDFADDEWRRVHPVHRPHWGVIGKSLAYLITCDWCTSVYVAAATVAGISRWTDWLPHPDWVAAVSYGLTASAVTALVSRHLDNDD